MSIGIAKVAADEIHLTGLSSRQLGVIMTRLAFHEDPETSQLGLKIRDALVAQAEADGLGDSPKVSFLRTLG